MSTSLSSVRLPAVSSLWPRARRLLALAFVAAVAVAVTTATTVPHALATAVVDVQRWVAARSELDVFLVLVGLFVVAVGISVATAIEHADDREIFDVR